MTACACTAGPALMLLGRKGAGRRDKRDAPKTPKPEPAYEISGILGEGAFGRVVRATSPEHGVCCLKIVKACGASDREAAILEDMDHPHIVRMMGKFMRGRRLYIAMELCVGGDLVDEVERRGRLAEVEARAAFKQIMSAVAHMHSNAIAHRDLKLENIVLAKQGVPLAENTLKIIDFGFATRFAPGVRSMKTRCGSEGFVAPEVLFARGYDECCDIWSCGVILHCLLCSELPFGDLDAVRSRCPTFGGPSVKFTVANSSRDFVERMLRKSPGDRPFAHEVVDSAWMQEGIVKPVEAWLSRSTTASTSGSSTPSTTASPLFSRQSSWSFSSRRVPSRSDSVGHSQECEGAELSWLEEPLR